MRAPSACGTAGSPGPCPAGRCRPSPPRTRSRRNRGRFPWRRWSRARLRPVGRLRGAERCKSPSRVWPGEAPHKRGLLLSAWLAPRGRGVSLTTGGGAGAGAPGRRRAGRRAGRGVSARSLTAGIWGVIERGGRPGARVGLHEQLNVIRPRPSRSSCVIDNPAAFLPGPRHQTGCRRRAGPGAARGDSALPGLAWPFSPRRPRPRGETQGPALLLLGGPRAGPPGAAGRAGAEGTRWPGAPRARAQRSAGRSEQGWAPESGTKSLEPGKKEWKQRRRRGGGRRR